VAPLQHPIDQAGEFMSHGGDGFWCAEFAAETAVLGAEVGLAPQQRGGCQTQGRGGAIDDMAGALAQHVVAADAIVGTEAQPRCEMRLGRPARHVHAPSLMTVWATPTSMPSIRVRSTPLIRCSSPPKSNGGAWLPDFRRR